MAQVTDGVAYMHSFTPPVVHRDLKPANILIYQVNQKIVAKVGDFGLGKVFGSAHSQTMTTIGGTVSSL